LVKVKILEEPAEIKTYLQRPRRIFLLGMSPMPFENDRKVYGTGIRTWHLAAPLIENGHKLCVCNYAIPSAYPGDFDSVFSKSFRATTGQKDSPQPEFEYNILSKPDFENPAILSVLLKEFEPDCIIGSTFYPSCVAARLLGSLEKKLPFWADLFGHVMAEAQARARMDDDDGCLFHYWNSEYEIITSADIFSCVSKRQEYALVGELGAAGRLNKYTSGYDFSAVIPCGMPQTDFEHKKNVIRGLNGISEEDFVVLWTGGYNTWTDVDTLFKGLENAISKNRQIKFVSTGGEIPEQDMKTYPRFLEMIAGSKFRDNFVMNGWIAGEDVPSYYFEADIGINIDKDIYEVRLGSKSRILDWMRAGLCVLSSNVCELTEIMQNEKAGYTFLPHDPQNLAEKILYLASDPAAVKETAARGRQFGMVNFNFDVTTKKLQEWAANPVFAPDYEKPRQLLFDREEALKNLDSISIKQAAMINARDARINELESIVKKGPVYRIYGYFRILKRKLFKKQIN
jgi:glycosyltransferase involved in cell wall biosynthesis